MTKGRDFGILYLLVAFENIFYVFQDFDEYLDMIIELLYINKYAFYFIFCIYHS